jgi:hypothetical protein
LITALGSLYSKSIFRSEVISFLEHGGLTLWGDDEMWLRCHLIDSSLSRFVNTPSNLTAICGNGEYCVVQFRYRSESCIVESTFHTGLRPLLFEDAMRQLGKEIEQYEMSSESDTH